MQSSLDLQEWFGGIDIYLFDQLLKRRLVAGMRVLDAGCGTGRNLTYFLRSGYEVFGVDESEEAIAQTRQLAAELAPHLPAENFRVEPVERMSFGKENSRQQTAGGLSADYADFTDYIEREGYQQPALSGQQSELGRTENIGGFDVVLSSAVLHFARDEQQWQAMVDEMWRVLKPGGIFFVRLASTIGMEDRVGIVEGRRYHLPDGSDRFLVDAAMLQRVTAALGGDFIEPIKTTVVENMRAMTTWVVRKK
jgi:tellurite methyltransferase